MFRPISNQEFIQAAASGDLDSMNRYFIENENSFSEINSTNQDGNTALMCASTNGHTEVVRLLLTMPNIAINAANCYGATALMLAAKGSHTEAVRLLLDRPDIAINIARQDGWTALSLAAQYGHTEAVRLLLARPGIAINAVLHGGWTALSLAAQYGRTEAVRLLLARPGIAINAACQTGDTALMDAAEEGHTEVVRLLLDRPDIAINTARQDGWTALKLAAEDGHTEVVRLLLARPDIAINTTSAYGNTALMLAAAKDRLAVVRLLLEAGADTQLKNKKGKTAEMLSATDEIRNLILDTALENKLAAFEIKRARLMNPQARTPEDLQIKSQLERKATKEGVEAALTADEERVKAQLEREKIAAQNAVDLTFKSTLADLDFLLAHRDKIKDFSSLPNVVMRFSEFIGTLADDKDLDAYSRQLRRVAASMGHGLAQHIESHFNEAETGVRDKSPAPRERSSLGFFSMPPETPDRWGKEDARDRRENR